MSDIRHPIRRLRVAGSLRLRARLLRLFPARTSKDFITAKPQRSWPKGYEIAQLGPLPLLKANERAGVPPS